MIYRLYVDESGDHTYRHLDRIESRFLGLTGILIEAEYYKSRFQPELEQLKQQHFPHSPDDLVILHRQDLLYKKGPFWRLRDKDNQQVFNKDLLEFFSNQQYIIITVVIDKKQHKERHGVSAYHPYHYCLAAMLERYCGFLNQFNHQGDVLAEQRGAREDQMLKEAYRVVYRTGTYFRASRFFSKVLTSKELKLKPKTANIAGLQIADLLAYPCKEDILIDTHNLAQPKTTFGREICTSISTKYNHQVYVGRIWGYGKILL